MSDAVSLRDELMSAEKPVLVKFGSPTCRPCSLMIPVLEEFAKKYAGQVIVKDISIFDDMDLAREHGVLSVPTIVLLKNGQTQKSHAGYMDLDELEEMFVPLF